MTEVVSVEREVAAPADTAWAMVSDVTRMGQWSPEAVGSRWLGEASGPAVGARFRGRNRRGWRRWSTTARVVECEQGRTFAFDVSSIGLKVARWGYRFEPTSSGCRVEERWEDHRGVLIKAIGRLAIGVSDRAAHNRQGMTQTLERLAAAAASAPSPSGSGA
jgi:Polyketide cyclase / dehydrase and lipid transport